MINLECPECDGNLRIKKIPYLFHNQINLGEFEAEVCNKCGSTYFTEESFKEIQLRAKILGLWGREALQVEIPKITTSARRMPKTELSEIFTKLPYYEYKKDLSVSVI